MLAAASFAHAQSAPAAPPADLDQLAAYQLTSIAGNVVITQLVDQKVGVHVKRPKGIFQ